MRSSLTHTALVLLAASTLACGESIQPGSASAPLPLVLPESAALVAPRMDAGFTSVPATTFGDSTAGRLSHQATPSTSDLPLEFQQSPSIQGANTKAYFYPYNSSYVAIAEGYMWYYGNRGQQTTSVMVTTEAGQLLSASEVTSDSHWLPSMRAFQSFARIPLLGNCGFGVMGSTAHKAWHQLPMPGPWSGEFGSTFDNSSSSLVRMSPCSSTVTTTGPGGGTDDSRIADDEWYICYWYVTYNSLGAEVSRQLLYCRPM